MKKSAALSSAKWFIGDPHFEHIVDYCRLKPVNDWRVWQDEDGNILRLTSNKKIRIFSSSKPSTTSDIYRYAKPSRIAEYSYWAMLFKDSSSLNIWFNGYDERLRVVEYSNNKFQNQQPLFVASRCGIKMLRNVVSLIGTSTKIKITGDGAISVSTLWPPDLPLNAKIDPIIEGLLKPNVR